MSALRTAAFVYLVLGVGALLLGAIFLREVVDQVRHGLSQGVPLDGIFGPGDIFGPEQRIGAPIVLGALAVLTGWGLLRARPWALVAGLVLATGGLLVGIGAFLAAMAFLSIGGYALYAVIILGPIALVAIPASGFVLWLLARGRSDAWPGTRADLPGFAALGVVLVLAVLGHTAVLAWDSAVAARRAQEEQVAQSLQRRLHVTATLFDSSVGVSHEEGDFGTEGSREVRVRVVERLELQVTIAADGDVVLAETPYVCLWTRFWNRGGDACWGRPDLQALVAAELATDPDGRPMLLGSRPISIHTSLERDPSGCDFPPGTWTVEFIASPLEVSGYPLEAQVPIEVPLDGASGQLTGLLKDVNFCADAAGVSNVQGEPPER